MSTSLDLYNADCTSLARTLTIKSNALAKADELLVGKSTGNAHWEQKPKALWRYYMNLAGEYHDSNVMMQVVSLDTLKTIDFTKENLQLHPTTRSEYRYGTSYYKALVSLYPDQEHLILHILNPIDKEEAIRAKDFTILSYNDTFIETWETNLIPKLQEMLYHQASAWLNYIYDETNSHSPVVRYFHMMCQLPNWIKLIRLNNCKTEYAHSFHVWTYLDGYNNLGIYKHKLSRMQEMYLYRNITRLQRMAGTNEVFDELVKIFLTESNIPIYKYEAIHNNETFVADLKSGVEMIRSGLNISAENAINSKDSIPELMTKEVPLSSDGGDSLPDLIESATRELTYSTTDRQPTRVLESEMLDNNLIFEFSLTDWLMNEWLIMSSNGRYQTTVTIQNPINNDTYTLTAKDALILYLYTYAKSKGITLNKCPIINTPIGHLPLPPNKEALGKSFNQNYFPPGWLDSLYENLPTYPMVQTPAMFYDKVSEIHARWKRHMLQFKVLNDDRACCVGNIVVSNFYGSWKVQLENRDITYDEWLYQNNIKLEEVSEYDLSLLSTDIFQKATGANLHVGISQSDLQKTMVSIVERLSGYHLQFLSVTPQDETLSIWRKTLRFSQLLSDSDNLLSNIGYGIYAYRYQGCEVQPLGSDSGIELDPLIGGMATLRPDNDLTILGRIEQSLDYSLDSGSEMFIGNLHSGVSMLGGLISDPPVKN